MLLFELASLQKRVIQLEQLLVDHGIPVPDELKG